MSVYGQHTPAQGNGVYFKPEDKKNYELRIVSDPVIFDNVFEQGDKTSIQTKYAWKVWNFTDGQVQVFQLPGRGYKAIDDIATNPKFGDPLSGKWDFDYKRTGTGTDTVHSIMPTPVGDALTEEQQAEIDKLDLVALVSAGKGAQRVQLLEDVIKAGDKRAESTEDDVVIEDMGDEPINLDDIPFGN